MMPSLYSRAIAPALLASLLLSVSPLARAQSAPTIDLPAQSLADSLRAVAGVTHTNIAFDATAIAGVQAQALNGRMTAEQAVARLLAGTALHWFSVDAHTIRVEANDQGGNGPQARNSSRRGAKEESEASGPSPAADHDNGQSGEASAPVELSEVVVTGTHIHGAATASPTITITRDQIERSGYVDVGDVIRSLPQNFSAGNNPQTEPNNTPIQGNGNISGGSSPNLRGLGPTSTLTLVNGHRLGQDGPLGAVDISLIPLSAIERIDVVTDSSSAAYGSDAVAGVVNFILRKDYEGAATSGSLAGSTDGGGYERDVNQIVGRAWGSGGAVAAYEHQSRDALWSYQRDFASTAANPTSLLPASSRDSGYLSAHQDVTNAVALFADGLYTGRESDEFYTYPPALNVGTLTSRVSVREYLADFGMNLRMADDWNSTIYASTAAQRSQIIVQQLAPGSGAERQINEEVYGGATRVAEISADGPVWNLGTDSIRAAIGGGYRQEGLNGTGSQTLRTHRGIRYGYAELNIPLAATPALRGLRVLNLNMSGRYDGYTGLGGKVVPKIGLRYAPDPAIELHATWSEAFRAPTLDSLYSRSYMDVLVLPDPLSPTRASLDLVRYGGNPQLRAETAKSWTTGIDWRPTWLKGAQARLSYFDIRYRDRVLSLSNQGTALTDPANAQLVVRNPSPQLQQSIIDSVAATGGFYNYSGQPYDPENIAALVDARFLNIAEQNLRGVDLVADYDYASRLGDIDGFANGSYMQLSQRITSDSPEPELAGRTFNPPRFRARAGVTWSAAGWAATGIVNWTAASVNTYLPAMPPVGSWTSFDVQLRYAAPRSSLLAGFEASLSVQNILDRDPPFVQYFGNPVAVGFNYDSNNFSPIGRFISLQISKKWFPKRGQP